MNNKEWAIHVLAQPEAHSEEMVETARRLLASIEAREAAEFAACKAPGMVRRPLGFYIA